MPRLAERADRGRLYTRSYASTSRTQPTHASILTGLHPWEHGVTRNGLVMADDWTTVPEVLQGAGYGTAAVVASFPLERRFGFAQGFDRYDDRFTETSSMDRWGDEEVPAEGFYSLADTVLERSLEALDVAGEGDQLFWFHFFDPHDPYGDTAARDPDTPDDGERSGPPRVLDKVRNDPEALPQVLELSRRLYDRDASFLDRQLDLLLERLENDADRFETHVVITADHGESLGEDGSIGHGDRVTDAQVHVPTLLLSPRVEPGIDEAPTGSVDLAATLLALVGLDPAAEGIGGRDLLDPEAARGAGAFGMRSTAKPGDRTLRLDGRRYPVEGNLFFAVDREGRKVIGDHKAVEGAVNSEQATLYRRLFRSFEQALSTAGDAEALEDDETREALRALGYLN